MVEEEMEGGGSEYFIKMRDMHKSIQLVGII